MAVQANVTPQPKPDEDPPPLPADEIPQLPWEPGSGLADKDGA